MSRDYSCRELIEIARARGLDFIDVANTVLPDWVLETIPHTVLRELVCLPLDWAAEHKLKVVVADPDDAEIADKLQFIIDRKIELGFAVHRELVAAIERYIGPRKTV